MDGETRLDNGLADCVGVGLTDQQIDRLFDFLMFVSERENIRHRRWDLLEPKPWTDDPILRNYTFCNIYREEDRGTKWAIKNIITPNSANDCNLVFQTIAYRSINRIKTIEHVGLPDLTSFDADLFCQGLSEVKQQGWEPITGRAYRIWSIEGMDSRGQTCTFMVAAAHQQLSNS